MDDFQFDDLFYDQDDELTKQLVEEYYDDLAFGLPLDSPNDF